MKKLLLLITLPFVFSGCASSPVTPAKNAKNGVEIAGSILGTTAAAAGGYLLGGLIDNNDASKAIGAATSAAVYVAVTEQKQVEKNKNLAESYEQGRRDGRVEASKEYWDEVTDANGDLVRNAKKLKKGSVRQIQYDGRYIEGVNTGGTYRVDPNTGLAPLNGAEKPALNEPARAKQNTTVVEAR